VNDDGHEVPDNAGVISPPPLIYAGALIVGLLVNALFPVAFLPRLLSRMLGWPLVVGGLLVGVPGLITLRGAGTTPSPYELTTALVVEGPYRFTRNPLYLGMALMYGGFSARANALWPILLLPFVQTVMRRGVIEREERYLERRFGEEYLRYKARVRRWI
jgi:protein-S-isoprenylcysteine O-methyltransferase Ste14